MLKREDVLINKQIKVMPIQRTRSFIDDKNHDGYFMYTGCVRSYPVPVKKSGGLLPIINKDEEEFFEDMLNLEKGALSFHNKKKDGFWTQRNFCVTIDKEGMILDLSDPMDYLKWRLLKEIPEIAPDWDSRYNGNYWFALVDQEYEDHEESRKTMLKLTVAEHFSKIKNSPTKLRNFLRVYGKKAPANASQEWMVSEIGKLMDSTVDVLEKMKLVFEDKSFDMKLFISKAVDCGALKLQANKYMLPGGDVLAIGIDATVAVLEKSKKEQDAVYATIATRVENFETGIDK